MGAAPNGHHPGVAVYGAATIGGEAVVAVSDFAFKGSAVGKAITGAAEWALATGDQPRRPRGIDADGRRGLGITQLAARAGKMQRVAAEHTLLALDVAHAGWQVGHQ